MLAELRLRQFRSYIDDSFEFDPGVNIIVGPNASGKTNLLEAVLVSARGSSYRVKDVELIAFDDPWARLEARLLSGSSRIVKLTRDTKPTKQFLIDDKPFIRLTLQKRLPVVLFEPDHLRLLSGGPDRRRAYLDDLLEQTTPGYSSLRRQYARTLAQRNSLLKQVSGDVHAQLFPWDVRLAHLGGQIVRARSRLTIEIGELLPELYKEIAHGQKAVSIQYACQADVDGYETALLTKLESSVDTDKMRGFTGSGPHLDDLIILVDGHLASEMASRGEVRTIILVLKVIELQLLQAVRDTTPLLLLDDVFSELDGARRHALTDKLAPYQTFITTTDADVVLHQFSERANVISMIR
jgi:DNA replication and repair protein RecF